MWQANFLIIVYATLGSFCLEIVPKTNTTSEMSNVARHFGRLVIGSGTKLISNKNKESNSKNPQAVHEDTEGYQYDQPASTAWHEVVESKLRRLNPAVYCGGDAMTLHVQGSIMPNFMIDGGDGPIPLTRIPANCGLSVTQGPTDAVFTVHYQGCHVTQQGDGHVLPLRLWGIPMKMSCPLAPYALLTVSCLVSGMVTKIGCKSADVLKLKVNGKWDPFIPASSTCGFTTESETDGVLVTAPYQSSCWQIKDGKRFLSILYGNEEFTLSCPDSQDPQPYGHVGIVSYQRHEPSVTPPTDTITTTHIGTATTGLASNPEQPMSYPSRHMYYGYAWAIPARTSTAPSVTSSPATNAPATVSTSKSIDMMYPFPQMYLPFSPMSYKPMLHGHPWAFPAKAPTTAPTTTVPTTKTPTTSTKPTIVASNPQQSVHSFNQMYYPYGPMPYHHKPMRHGYPWAFPAKASTTAPTTIAPTTKTASTPSIVASNPQQSVHSFNHMYYPHVPMPYHNKPMTYGYRWAFPAKAPTTAPTTKTATTSQTTARTLAIVASDPQQLYYPFGPMHCHHRPSHYLGYPLAFPVKASTTAPKNPALTTKTTFALTTKTATTATTPTILASNFQQSAYPSRQMPHPFGSMPYRHMPMPYGDSLAFPAKAPSTAPTAEPATAAATPTIIASNPQQFVYPFNRMYSMLSPMHYQYKPTHLGYPWAFPATIPKTTSTAPTTSSPQMYYPFVPMHFTKNLAPWMYYYNHNQLQKGLEFLPTTSTPPVAIKHKMSHVRSLSEFNFKQ